jgi:hypothetical protein
MRSLHDVQRDFRRALLGGDDTGAAADVLDDELTAQGRLALYRHHVFATLTDVLEATFPVVCRLVDARFFRWVADWFIRDHPPEGPCLFEYGARLPEFLARFPACQHLRYLPDVARLEWALNAALHAEDVTPLDPSILRAMAPEMVAQLTLRLDPSVTLLRSPWPIARIWHANQPGSDPDAVIDLDDGGVCLEVRRRADEAAFRELTPAAHALRDGLARGKTLEEAAVDALAEDTGFDLAAALGELLAEGVVVRAEPGESLRAPGPRARV